MPGSPPSGDTNRTILFADVRDSSRITERLGNVDSRQLIGALMTDLGATTVGHNGTVIKTIGDEIMSAFGTPLDAALAAIDMQRALLVRPPVDGVRPQIGIGLNAGPVVIEAGDVFGDVVNVASRLVGKAMAGQILTTGATLDGLEEAGIFSRTLGEHVMRGRGEPVKLCEILWRGETAQLTALAPKFAEVPHASLELRLADQVVKTTSEEAEAVTMGRGAENSLVVAGTSASRLHAKITTRSGRFYLVDHSTNGTFVRQAGDDEISVHIDEVLLTGSGFIRLGAPLSEEGALDIAFRTSGNPDAGGSPP